MTEEQDVLRGVIGPVSGSIRGQNAIYIGILAATLGFLGFILWHDVLENRIASHSEHVTIQEGIDEMVYIQSLPEEKKKDLDLTMPESLAKKRRIYRP